jgi:acyl-CoA dehydrogenase
MSVSMIEESAARLFAENSGKALLERFEGGQWPGQLWSLVVDHGFNLALASEDGGGIAATWSEAYPILRGLGYWQVPLPLAETMVASLLLSQAGVPIPEGPIALIDEEQARGLTFQREGGLNGKALKVPWGRYCSWAVASLPEGLVLVDLAVNQRAPGSGIVSVVKRSNAALEPVDELGFANAVPVRVFDHPWTGLKQPLLLFGALCRSVMMVGAMEWLLEQSVQYAKDRVQFGKPIGRNQAIQQALALMAGEVACARMAAQIACADALGATEGAEGDRHTFFSVAVAKVRTGEAASRCASIAHQVHGAIGFTYEHALNFATRRLWAWREAYGADALWAQRLGEAAIAGGEEAFWPALTERRFPA